MCVLPLIQYVLSGVKGVRIWWHAHKYIEISHLVFLFKLFSLHFYQLCAIIGMSPKFHRQWIFFFIELIIPFVRSNIAAFSFSHSFQFFLYVVHAQIIGTRYEESKCVRACVTLYTCHNTDVHVAHTLKRKQATTPKQYTTKNIEYCCYTNKLTTC